MLPFSFLRLVSCVADRFAAPRLRRPALACDPDREQAAPNQDATTCLPKLSKSAVNRGSRFRPTRRPLRLTSCRTVSPTEFNRKSFSGLALRHSGRVNLSGVACPRQPVPRVPQQNRSAEPQGIEKGGGRYPTSSAQASSGVVWRHEHSIRPSSSLNCPSMPSFRHRATQRRCHCAAQPLGFSAPFVPQSSGLV